ncbi:hypothetical protein BSLG_004615 [Batrachochytrium salamandrivorans]|nr:hypothetical protein BSLG_004615 [Batrachochytrium salamandrivorans]
MSDARPRRRPVQYSGIEDAGQQQQQQQQSKQPILYKQEHQQAERCTATDLATPGDAHNLRELDTLLNTSYKHILSPRSDTPGWTRASSIGHSFLDNTRKIKAGSEEVRPNTKKTLETAVSSSASMQSPNCYLPKEPSSFHGMDKDSSSLLPSSSSQPRPTAGVARKPVIRDPSLSMNSVDIDTSANGIIANEANIGTTVGNGISSLAYSSAASLKPYAASSISGLPSPISMVNATHSISLDSRTTDTRKQSPISPSANVTSLTPTSPRNELLESSLTQSQSRILPSSVSDPVSGSLKRSSTLRDMQRSARGKILQKAVGGKDNTNINEISGGSPSTTASSVISNDDTRFSTLAHSSPDSALKIPSSSSSNGMSDLLSRIALLETDLNALSKNKLALEAQIKDLGIVPAMMFDFIRSSLVLYFLALTVPPLIPTQLYLELVQIQPFPENTPSFEPTKQRLPPPLPQATLTSPASTQLPHPLSSTTKEMPDSTKSELPLKIHHTEATSLVSKLNNDSHIASESTPSTRKQSALLDPDSLKSPSSSTANTYVKATTRTSLSAAKPPPPPPLQHRRLGPSPAPAETHKEPLIPSWLESSSCTLLGNDGNEPLPSNATKTPTVILSTDPVHASNDGESRSLLSSVLKASAVAATEISLSSDADSLPVDADSLTVDPLISKRVASEATGNPPPPAGGGTTASVLSWTAALKGQNIQRQELSVIMSTFASSKRTLFQTGEDTPAPNAYAVDQTLLNNDSYKQFGFLEKSQRFQSQASKDRQPANADGLVSSEGNVLSRSPSPPVPPRIVRNDKEEINKLKRELSRQSTTIERHQIKYEREAHTLHERLQKTESQLQLAIKEKATLLSQSMLKEKTLHDLQQQHLVLKNHAEKLEKSNTGLYEKTLQVGPLRKKVEDLEKLTTRTKTHIDRKMAHENETLVMQMQKMKTDLDTVVSQKESLSSSVHSLKTETRDQRESIASLNLLLTSAKENYDTAQKRWRDERAEYEKRTTLLSDQLEAEKADFSDIVKTLKASEAAAREAAHAAKSSAEHQRSAYLQRIAQLEGDLDIVERAVVDKTKHNEALVEKSRSTQEALQQQLAELSIKADRADGMAQLEYEIQQLRSTYQRDTTHLENAVADAVTGRDDERQRLERKISTLSQQIVHLEGERREASHSYTLSLEAKTALVSAKDAELKELNKLVESTKAHAEEIQFSNDDLTQTIAKLHVQIQSQSSASDASQQSLLGKLRDSQSDAELLHRQIDDLKRRHAEAVEQSRAETVNALQHREHLSTQMSDAQRDYSTERKQFQHDIANLESQIDDLQHQLSVATRQAALVSHERDLEVGALKSRAKELEAAMTAATADANSKEVLYTKSRADLDHELAALRSRLDVETSRYQQRIDALDADLERTLSHLRELEDDNARLGRTCTQLEAFGKTEQAEFHLRLDAMSNQLAERANEMAAVTAVVAKLEEDKLMLIKQADAARVALSADSECLSKQIADLEGQLETATVELQSATTTVGQLESIVADGNNALLALREELKLSEEAVSDLQKKHVEATTQAASLAETLSKAQSDHASEMEMACNLRNELQRDLAASVSHSEVLQFEVLVAGQTQQQQESDLACLRQKLDLEAKQADAQQLLLDTTRTRLETCIRESSDLQGRIATMVSEKLLLVATHQAEMDSTRTAHSNAISEMEARLTKISAASEDLRDRLAERDGEILTLRSSRVQSESEQQSLVRDLDMTRQNLQENIASLSVAQQSLLEIRKDLDVEKKLTQFSLVRTGFESY